MPKLSFFGKRILVGVTLLVALLATLNFVLEWGLFGMTDKKVMVGCYVLLAFVMFRWLPTREEWDEHRKLRGGG